MARLADEFDRFRWAACQLDVLSGCLSQGKLRQTLGSLPETLDETYDRILCKIDRLFKREVLHILQWLTCSLRPLSLDEVAEIVTFDVDSDYKFDDENRLAEPEDVLNMCSSLVISVEPDSKSKVTMVRLAHFSVKEYLVSDRIRTGSAAFFSIDEEASNTVIGAIGLSCLQLYDEALYHDSREFSMQFPLAKYSARFWHCHLSTISGAAHLPLRPLASELFLSEWKLRNWIALYDLDSDDEDTALCSPIRDAVLTGVRRLLRAAQTQLQKDKDGQVEETKDSKLRCSDPDNGWSIWQYEDNSTYLMASMIFRIESRARKQLGKELYPACIYDTLKDSRNLRH